MEVPFGRRDHPQFLARPDIEGVSTGAFYMLLVRYGKVYAKVGFTELYDFSFAAGFLCTEVIGRYRKDNQSAVAVLLP